MKISHDGNTVRFKTEPEELFLIEKSGEKPNTVCIIDNDEYEMLNAHTPKKIIIQYQQEIFLRTLTNLHFARLFGKVIVIFSWANEGHHHPSPRDTEPCASCKHSQSIGDEPLWLHEGEKTTGIVSFPVSEAYAATGPHSIPVTPGDHNLRAEEAPASKEPSIDERFAAITISNGMLSLLQFIANRRTMNAVIRELHKAYLEKNRREMKAYHD